MKKLRFCLALILCISVLASLPVFAFAEEEYQLVDPDELQQITEQFIADNGLNEKNFSVGYCYTATGDTWYFNGDEWYYSASMYKVPLMMMLAELEAKGEIDRDTPIKNLPLGQAEESILTYSHNDFAHLMMSYFGTEPDCRDLYKQYSDLPDDYYISDFRDYSYFTAHFMTDVMKVLYYENERFPNIVECLLAAQPENYYNRTITDYDVAQKYGALKEFNHTTAIVYTPNPFIITVMTRHCGPYEQVISDYGKLMEEYTLKLDEKLDEYNKQLEEQKKAEEEAKKQEELKKQQEEQARREAEEKAKLEAQATPEPTVQPETEEEKSGSAGPILVAAAALMMALVMFVFARKAKRSRRKTKYTPRH
ncbi:MAG: hypothetical protein IJ364_04315 [Oscillospiraceae bacterium]|nr:hypothetical protein [Oscillospiraceae bacterium]